MQSNKTNSFRLRGRLSKEISFANGRITSTSLFVNAHQQVEGHSQRVKTQANAKIIDRDCLSIICKKAPAQFRQFLKKTKIYQRQQTVQISKRHSQLFSQVYNKERNRTIIKIQQKSKAQLKIRELLQKNKQKTEQFYVLNHQTITSFQQKYKKKNTMRRQTIKYSKDPLSDIYNKQSTIIDHKTAFNIQNPFERIQS